MGTQANAIQKGFSIKAMNGNLIENNYDTRPDGGNRPAGMCVELVHKHIPSGLFPLDGHPMLLAGASPARRRAA